MPDEKNDAVKMEEYNKIVGAHNEMKARYEKVENELRELKENKQTEEKIQAERKVWETEKAELKKQQEEMNKKIEEISKRDNTVVSKGVINPPQNPNDDFKRKLDSIIPEPKVRTSRLLSARSRMMHYKSPVTKQYSKEELGKGLSLHATAQQVNPDMIPQEARQTSGDIKIR